MRRAHSGHAAPKLHIYVALNNLSPLTIFVLLPICTSSLGRLHNISLDFSYLQYAI